MTKRAREDSIQSLHSEPLSHSQHANVDSNLDDGDAAAAIKKARTNMATLVSGYVRSTVYEDFLTVFR